MNGLPPLSDKLFYSAYEDVPSDLRSRSCGGPRPALTAPRRAFPRYRPRRGIRRKELGAAAGSAGRAPASPPDTATHAGSRRSPGLPSAYVRGGARPGAATRTVPRVLRRCNRGACCDRCVGGCVEAAAAAEQKQKQSRRAYLPKLGVVEFRRLSPKSCGFLGKCFRYKYDYVLDYRAFSRLIFNERPPGGRLKRAKDPNGSLITT